VTVVLSSPTLLVRLDPEHGGEVLDLVDRTTGRQLLGRPPFGSALPRGGDLEEDVWTEAYRGGWQTVLPNAGNPCEVDGARHGFHGRASNDPWELLKATGDEARLAWRGHGLSVLKHVRVGEVVRVDYVIEADTEPAPLIALEHLSVGLELLDPGLRIGLPEAAAYELDERTGPVRAPEDCARWPYITLLNGSRERGDELELDRPRSRLLAVQDLPEGRCSLYNAARGQGIELRWDHAFFPHLWMWHEQRVTGGVWRGLTETLVVEPASVPHTLGLARAIAEDQQHLVRPGAALTPWIEVKVTH
jgi:hypothetical protein